jgi:hypothetical protein
VTTHLGLMALFSVFVSIVFAVLMRDEPVEQAKFGAQAFAGFMGAALVIGWLLYPLPL